MDQTRQARKRKEIYRAQILLNKTEIEIIQYMRFYFIKLTLLQREQIDIKISNFLGRRVRFIYSDSPRIKFSRREENADSSIYRERMCRIREMKSIGDVCLSPQRAFE